MYLQILKTGDCFTVSQSMILTVVCYLEVKCGFIVRLIVAGKHHSSVVWSEERCGQLSETKLGLISNWREYLTKLEANLRIPFIK